MKSALAKLRETISEPTKEAADVLGDLGEVYAGLGQEAEALAALEAETDPEQTERDSRQPELHSDPARVAAPASLAPRPPPGPRSDLLHRRIRPKPAEEAREGPIDSKRGPDGALHGAHIE